MSEPDYNVTPTCPLCGKSRNVVETAGEDVWKLGDPPVVTLKATVPVIECRDCNERFTDWRGEDIRELISKTFMPWVAGTRHD